MLVFRFSRLPVLVSVPPEKEGRTPILCVVSQSQWVIIVGAPLRLHCVPASFPPSLGSTVWLGTFSNGVGFLIVERQLWLPEASAEGIEATYPCLPGSHLAVGSVSTQEAVAPSDS